MTAYQPRRGMIPITKNISVVDAAGHEYEKTYPKRAKGLVKNGRARFVDEATICLACPPNIILEDNDMSDKIDCTTNMEVETPAADKLSMDYVLTQIEKISLQTEHLHQALQTLGEMADGDNAEGMSVGNTLGQAKAAAIGDIVRCRETTNQQLLKFYENMYNDLKPKPETLKEKALKLTERTWNNPALTLEDKEAFSEILDSIRRIGE